MDYQKFQRDLAERDRLRRAILKDRQRQERADRLNEWAGDLCTWGFFLLIGLAAGIKIAGA